MKNLFKTLTLAGALGALALPLPATADAGERAIVATQTIERGDIILPEQIGLAEEEMRVSNRALTAKKDVIGKEAVRTLRAGRPIYARYVRIPPDAKQGEDIVLRFETRGIVLEGLGRAMEDGQAGQNIRVLSYASNSVINGTVLESGIVIVQ